MSQAQTDSTSAAVVTTAESAWHWQPRRPRVNWTPALMIAPAVIALLLIGIYPLFYALRTSFQLYQVTKPYLGTPWVGFANYATALQDALFWSALSRTGLFFVYTVPVQIVYPQSRLLAAKVRAFVDFAAPRLARALVLAR